MNDLSATEKASRLTSRPRILHIVSGDLWAGAESSTYNLLAALSDDCSIHAVVLNHGELERKLREHGISVTVLDENSRSSLEILKSLREIIRDTKPDLIHTHRQKENILASVANLTTLQVPMIRTVHGLPESAPTLKSRLVRRIDQLFSNYTNRGIIAVSEDLKIKLADLYPNHSIKRIYNGVNAEQLKASATELGLRRQEPNCLHAGIIGRLVPIKRIDIFIETARLARLRDINIRFHIIGEGPERFRLERLAGDALMRSHLFFHGHRNDVASWIRSLDAIVMCSDHEGMPMIALEALALGTRLIVHDVGGLSELRNHRNVSMVTANKPELYLQALLAKPVQSDRDQLSGFSSRTQASETLAYYESLASGIGSSKAYPGREL